MSFLSSIPSVLRRAGLCAALVLLAGCATTTHPVAVEVTSPPTPRFGSGPIAAYDAYAAAWFSPVTGKDLAAARSARAAVEPKGPVATVEASMN